MSGDAGIGRQACLRGMCESSREGSSPFLRTMQTLTVYVISGDVKCHINAGCIHFNTIGEEAYKF